MTKVLFLRHGEARGNVDRVFHGWTNSQLTDNGKEQIKLLGLRLKDERIDVIYSSDLIRAYETAKEVAKYHNLDVIIDEDFREINGGDWECTPWVDMTSKFPESYASWLNTPDKLQMPNGESMVNFQQRLVKGVEKVVKLNKDKTIVIGTHGTAIKVLMCYYKKVGLADAPNQVWHDNASITTVLFDENLNSTVVCEGDNAHLGELSTLAKQSWWRKELIEGNSTKKDEN